jgi:hypothetical protein
VNLNWENWLLWGFASTVVLTIVLAGSQSMGFTRMNIPYLLGTLFTPNRDRAQVYGVLVHLLNGWIFSFVYVAAFHATGLFSWWAGVLVGLVHGAFVLVVGLPVMPGMHPRMASEVTGPTAVKQLEPPGFLGTNYGVQTPLWSLFAHALFGGMLGALYTP